ncbi:MAG TPA: nickel pincer cofactor biosynthesis protein LarB [Chloroflexota bacterium]|nr:nickel pincer cofactor biosynthesis protein LarB [Chloroflexota bacterium]
MDEIRLRTLLAQVRDGILTEDRALAQLRMLPYEDLEYARLDTHRALRTGMPETVYCPGKTPAQVAGIIARLAEHHSHVLATRASEEQAEVVVARLPAAHYHPVARAITIRPAAEAPGRPGILLLTAGTSDLPVAEEAALTAEMMGHAVQRVIDVGVAGLHRLLDTLPALRAARVLVVVAGMEGALPSVVAGLVRAPVVAVPTSTGYGASFGGLAALLAMLNSCAPGVAVVNIDNGFGAGRLAAMINALGGEDQ